MLPFPCMHSLRLWSGACDNAHLGPQTQASGPGLVLEREALGAATLHSGCILQSALSINPPSTLCCAYVPDIRRRISRHARPYSLRVNRPRPRPRHGFSARVTRIIAMMKQPTRNAIHSASLPSPELPSLPTPTPTLHDGRPGGWVRLDLRKVRDGRLTTVSGWWFCRAGRYHGGP